MTTNLIKLYEFTDEFSNMKNLKTFTRVFSKQSLHYVDSVLQYTTDNDVKYMPDLAKQEDFSFDVISMDLETKLKDNVMEPISVSTYCPSSPNSSDPLKRADDGYRTYFITDFNSPP